METPNEAIIERIKKLLTMAERGKDATNGTEEEASNAAAAAQRLMAKYNIELAMLDETDPAESTIGRDLWSASEQGFKAATKSMAWEGALASAIARAHYCVIVRIGGSNAIWFCGTPANRAVAIYMYSYLRRAGEALAKREYHTAHQQGRVALNHADLHSWRLGFFIGFRDALSRRYEEMAAALRTEYADNGSALMVMSQALAKAEADYAKLFDKLSNTSRSQTRVNSDGRARGTHHGNTINLNNRGIGSGAPKRPTGRITSPSRLLGK